MSLTPSKLRAATESRRDLENTQLLVGAATRFSLQLAISPVGREKGCRLQAAAKGRVHGGASEQKPPSSAAAAPARAEPAAHALSPSHP